MKEEREQRIASALAWIAGRLRELEVPFQVVGGLAALAHGASRELNDIDLYVPEGALERLLPELREHHSHGPVRYRDDRWDCYFMEVRYAGQEIELAEAPRTRYRRGPGHPWRGADVDFGASVRREVFGVEVQARSSEVVIRNHRTVPIFVLLLEREFAARANFAPCPRTGDCPRVEPGGRAALDRDRIGGVDPGSEEAVLAWWEVRPAADGGFEDTLMHSIVFPLR